jgi:Protein of unknown function (DUF1569)
MPSPAPINTKQLTGRRTLHFNTIDEALAEVDALAAANARGELRCLGNWSAGQNLGHLAAWVDYSFNGAPMKVPFFVRLMMKPMKGQMLYKPMKPGGRIPKAPGGTFGTDPLSFDDGVAAFRRTFTRLKSECPQLPNLLFGPMTHDEWTNLHLRHAELHLTFMNTDVGQ